MRAIVLVGGQGTRLQPLTWRTPKALVPVLNRPLLEHLLLHLKRHSITRITLAMTQQNAEIREAFGDGSGLGLEIEYAYEDTPLGSGGAIASVSQHWDEPFLVANGDILTDLDLSAMMAFHEEHDSELTMHLHEVEDPSQFGVAVTAEDGRITTFVEKPPAESAPSNLINAGNWLFEPATGRELDLNAFNRVEDGLFPAMCEANRPIFGFSQPSYWRDIGNSEALRLANLELAGGAIPGRVPESAGGVVLGEGASINGGATLKPPAVIGEGCTIGAGVSMTGTVCWDHVVLDDGASVQDSVLASGVIVGAGAVIERSVIAHSARIGANARVLDQQVEPDSVIEATT